MTTPRFSIAIPVYNRPDYLRQAIKSCLAQTVDDFEVVISDDCSSVDLKLVVDSFCDPRLKYSRSDLRLGAVKNHQRSVSLAEGTYVVNLDSDDMLLPSFLEVMGSALDRSPSADAIYCSMAILACSTISACFAVPRIRFVDGDVYSENPWLEKQHDLCPSCCLLRRSSFERHGGYRVSLRYACDWDLYMRFITSGGGVIFLPEVLAIYRKHDAQESGVAGVRDGLNDLLELWQENAYGSWRASDMADLAITVLSISIRKRSGLAEILKGIVHSGMAWRLAVGAATAIPRRIYRRLWRPVMPKDENFVFPRNLESAILEARALIAS